MFSRKLRSRPLSKRAGCALLRSPQKWAMVLRSGHSFDASVSERRPDTSTDWFLVSSFPARLLGLVVLMFVCRCAAHLLHTAKPSAHPSFRTSAQCYCIKSTSCAADNLHLHFPVVNEVLLCWCLLAAARLVRYACMPLRGLFA